MAIVVAAAGVAVVVFWLVTSRDGGDAFDVAACFGDPTASRSDVETQQPPTLLTLPEVRRRYDWYRFPSQLPPGATLGQLWARHRLCQPDVVTVYARIDGPNYWILIEQSTFTATWDPKTPIEIDGGPGDVFDNGAVTIYSWNHDGHSYGVSAKFGGDLTQEMLVQSLDTLE